MHVKRPLRINLSRTYTHTQPPRYSITPNIRKYIIVIVTNDCKAAKLDKNYFSKFNLSVINYSNYSINFGVLVQGTDKVYSSILGAFAWVSILV